MDGRRQGQLREAHEGAHRAVQRLRAYAAGREVRRRAGQGAARQRSADHRREHRRPRRREHRAEGLRVRARRGRGTRQGRLREGYRGVTVRGPGDGRMDRPAAFLPELRLDLALEEP